MRRRLGLGNRGGLAGYIFVAPSLVFLILFVIVPIFAALYYSLTDYDLMSSPSFAGLKNYRNLLSDNRYPHAVTNTLYFAFGTVPTGIVTSLLLAMLSRSPLAQALRREIITVFMAWRRGKLATTTDADHRWSMLEKRLDQLERLITSQSMVESPEFTKAATYAPPVFRLIRGDGKPRSQRYSPYWQDHEVRALMISLHRQMTLCDAVAAIADEVGADRAPSRTALQRIWKQLDKARAAA